jgi:hypothetical protein
MDLIESQDTIGLKTKLNNSANLDSFLKIIKKQINKSAGVTSTPDIYFDPNGNTFVFTIHCGSFISDGTAWGLFNYLFVIELRIDPNIDNNAIVKKTILIDNDEELKYWWRSSMKSYMDKRCLRDEWADKFGLIPPPPAPPKTTDWFKK